MRRTTYLNRIASTAACLTSIPTQVPKLLFPGVAALLLGAHDPHLKKLVRSHIGDINLKVDAHGDALGVANLPGDR